MRSTIIILAIIVAVCVGIFLMLRAESGRSCPVPILMYHEVGETTNSAWCVPTETFRAQMTSLREQGFKTIMPSDLAAHLRWGKPLPAKPVIITFDDGYLCNLTTVEPILKENGLRAVIYLITDRVAETDADRHEYEGKKCLVWPEVLAMQRRRTFTFGGHAHTHQNLAVEANPLPQIAECRRQLILHGICEPHSFCYPYGQYNQKTSQAVQQAGFQTAVACEDAVATIGPATNLSRAALASAEPGLSRALFALPRVSVMGGRHEFKLAGKSIDAGNKILLCRILHAGIPIEISACLRGSNNEQKSWLLAREVSQGEFELRFVLPDDFAGRGLVEIWDKHRLFKLAAIRL